VDLGLAFEDVEAGGEQLASLEGGRQGGLVHQWAACGVEQDRTGFHAPQPRRVDQVAGLRAQRHVQRHHVRFGQQRVQVPPGDPQLALTGGLQAMGGGVEDGHAEPGRAARHRLADAAEADDAERPPPQLHPEQELRRPDPRPPRPQPPVTLGDPPPTRQQQRPGQVGGRLGEHVGSIGDSDAPAAALGHVHVVVADRVVGHHPQLRPGRVEQLPIDPLGEQHHQPVLAGRPRQQLRTRHRPRPIPHVEVRPRGEHLHRR